MDRISAVCIDLDDTLWPIGPVIARAERIVHAWFEQHYPEVVRSLQVEDLRQAREEAVALYPDRTHDLTFLRKAGLGLLFKRAGYAEELAEQAFTVFWRARNQVELFADVRPALQRLRSRYTLVALSNGNADLKEVGLQDLFHHAVYAADVGAAKPDQAIFRAVVELTGLEPGELLHAGDDPVADMGGARRAGLYTAWVNRMRSNWPEDSTRPHAVVHDMHELADLLGA